MTTTQYPPRRLRRLARRRGLDGRVKTALGIAGRLLLAVGLVAGSSLAFPTKQPGAVKLIRITAPVEPLMSADDEAKASPVQMLRTRRNTLPASTSDWTAGVLKGEN